MEIRYPVSPEDVQRDSGENLRKRLVISDLFKENQITYVLSHHDRILIGGISLDNLGSNKIVRFHNPEELRGTSLLERREMGLVCLSGSAEISIDGISYSMNAEDIIYISRGSLDITLKGNGDFYFTSSICHTTFPTTLVKKSESNVTELGNKKNSNERTLRKYIHDQGVPSASMAMGITTIHEGSAWNTMPCHTHERRTEVYLYFDLDENEKVVHLFGRPNQTRNFILGNKEAVISPAWSIHTGAGTSNYKFVWSTSGENISYSDLDVVETKNLM